MNTGKLTLFGTTALLVAGCSRSIENEKMEFKDEGRLSYASALKQEERESSAPVSLTYTDELGTSGIAAFDKKTNKLFVVTNNDNKIDVFDISDPSHPIHLAGISVARYGGVVKSVTAFDGKVAAAIEGISKTHAGKVVVFSANDYAEVKVITVGVLPDVIKYSPDGKLIVIANKNKLSNDYGSDPAGTICLISVKDNYAVYPLDFSDFTSEGVSLKSKGLCKLGSGASFARDMQPECITISSDSRLAWVKLWGNNCIAKVDLRNKVIEEIFTPGFKNYNMALNSTDPGNRPLATVSFNNWPAYGIYQPEGTAVLNSQMSDDEEGESAPESGMKNVNRSPFRFSANERETRDYATFE